jgi:hypothetical protein
MCVMSLRDRNGAREPRSFPISFPASRLITPSLTPRAPGGLTWERRLLSAAWGWAYPFRQYRAMLSQDQLQVRAGWVARQMARAGPRRLVRCGQNGCFVVEVW